MTVRGLLALKARLWWRAIPPRRRVLALVLMGVFAVSFAPAWLGGARLAYVTVREQGAPGVVVALAIAQASWLGIVLILNRWSEAFDLRRMLRYPVHPRTVYLASVAFGMVEPAALVVVPALVAVVAATAARGGAAAGAAAALAVTMLVQLTGALLQLLLTLVDDLRRVRWLRYLQEALSTLIAGGGYLIYLEVRRRVAGALDHPGMGVSERLARAADALHRLDPFAAWPAAVAEHALAGRWPYALAALAASLLLLVALVELGWRLAHRVALDRETESASAPARATGAVRRAPHPPHGRRGAVALLFARELRLSLRGPQLLGFALYGVFIVLLLRGMGKDAIAFMGPFVTVMLSLQVQTLALSLFGGEREGLRLLFLLPFEGRALVLAKDLAAAVQFALTVGLALVALGFVGFPVRGAAGLEAAAWALALLLAALVVGNHLSARHPVRVDTRGRRGSGASPLAALLQTGSLFATLAVLAILRGLAHALAPEPARALAAALAASALALALGVMWWRLLGRAGRIVDESRESMLAAIATPSESG